MLRLPARLFLLVVILVGWLLAFSKGPLAAQESPYQVWYIAPTESDPLSHIEYRDADGSVVVSYTLTIDAFDRLQYGGGILYGTGAILYGAWSESLPLFDPTMGQIVFQRLDRVQAGPGQSGFRITRFAAHPSEPLYAYGIYEGGKDSGQPATSWIYVNSPGQTSARLVFTGTSDNLMAAAPFVWGSDPNTLIILDEPQANAGYSPSHDNVRVLDITTGALQPLGDVVSFASDRQQFTTYARDDSFATLGLNIHHIASGAVTFYPLPSIEETSLIGGTARFSPDKSKVVYQVMNGLIFRPTGKIWTVLVDVGRGESRILLEDESDGSGLRYGFIDDWLDNDTLVLRSAVLDVTTGTVLSDAPGSFLGFATDLTGFAPSGVIYAACPDAPVSRLMTQMHGRLAFTDGSPTNVRSWPGLEGNKIASWPEGATFTVLSGPTCADGYAWWDLEFEDGSHGYVAEGDLQAYYLEPWSND